MMNAVRKLLFLVRFHLFHKYKIKRTVKEEVLGKRFLVLPGVFNPKSYFSSKIFAEFVTGLDSLERKRVLDMGCGSGIIGIFAALKGADVVASDKNPASVECAEENVRMNSVNGSVKVIQSDLFDNIEHERFDIIFFNPPFYDKEPKDSFELGFNAGKGYRVIKNFAVQCGRHLKDNGSVYVIVSSDVKVDIIKNIFIENGFKCNLVLNKKGFFEEFYVFQFNADLR